MSTYEHPSRRPRPRKSLDGFIQPQPLQHPKTVPAPKIRAPEPVAAPQLPLRQEDAEPAPQPKKRRFRHFMGLVGQIAGLVALIGLGFLLKSVVFGQAALAAYAIFAIVFKIPSRTTFYMALISLAVVLLAVLRSDTALASIFATYTFLLLLIGAISIGMELKRQA